MSTFLGSLDKCGLLLDDNEFELITNGTTVFRIPANENKIYFGN